MTQAPSCREPFYFLQGKYKSYDFLNSPTIFISLRYDLRMEPTHILVVEDEASIAEVVSLYLKRAGFTVQIASDGKQAISVFQKQQPDFVILDLMLPQMDGLS